MTTILSLVNGDITGNTVTANTSFVGSGAGLTSIPFSAFSALTASNVVVTDSGGAIIAGGAQLSKVFGGFGQDVSGFATGVVKISSGTFSSALILNADINAAAAIAHSKMAALSINQAAITDASGFITSEAQLAPSRGGLGNNPTGLGTGLIKSNGTTILCATLVNADVSASAAIALSKLATVSADSVLIGNGSGVITSEAALATTRGGLGGSLGSLGGAGVLKSNGSTTVTSATIINSDISAVAAIDYSKLATIAAGVAISTGGTLSTEAQLLPLRGGTGQNFSGIGAGPFIPTISSGVFSATLRYATIPVANNLVQMDGSTNISVGQATATSVITPIITTAANLTVSSSGTGYMDTGVMPLRQTTTATNSYTPATAVASHSGQFTSKVATTNTTATTLATINLGTSGSGSSYTFIVRASWIVTGGTGPTIGNSGGQWFMIKARYDGATVTLSSQANNTFIRDAGLTGTNIDVTSPGTNVVTFRANGATNGNITWNILVDFVAQQY